MWEECVANEKGAWTGCGILFVRRLGGNPRASIMLYIVSYNFTTGSR